MNAEHSKETYRRIIREWCEATNMQPWDINDRPHMEIGGVEMALIYEEEDSPDMLHAYMDLGARNYPELHKQLLRENLVIDPMGHGHFALHPESESVVYRFVLPLSDLSNGETLPDRLAAVAMSAQQRLAT